MTSKSPTDRELLAFDFAQSGELQLALPGMSGWIWPGAPLDADLVRPLGLDVAGALSERHARLLAGLALARLEGRSQVTPAELAGLAWPGRALRTVHNALNECLLPEPAGLVLASAWGPAHDRRLVQSAVGDGAFKRARAPLRLNPRYGEPVAPVDRLQAWLAGPRRAIEPLSWAPLDEQVTVLTRGGDEAEAWRLLAGVADGGRAPSDPGFPLVRAQLGMQIGASREAEVLARAAAHLARAADDRVAAAEALHVVALTRRQLGDLAGSIQASREAIAAMRSLPPSTRTRTDRLWQYHLTLAITQSACGLRGAPFLRPGDTPDAWRSATRLFHQLARSAADRGRDQDVAHAWMRLMAHERSRWDLRDDAYRADEKADAGRPALSTAARVILDRVRATDALLRTGDPNARALLDEVRREAVRRGYRHQVAVIDLTFDQAARRAARSR